MHHVILGHKAHGGLDRRDVTHGVVEVNGPGHLPVRGLAAQDVHEGRLASPGRAHDGGHAARRELSGDPVQDRPSIRQDQPKLLELYRDRLRFLGHAAEPVGADGHRRQEPAREGRAEPLRLLHRLGPLQAPLLQPRPVHLEGVEHDHKDQQGHRVDEGDQVIPDEIGRRLQLLLRAGRLERNRRRGCLRAAAVVADPPLVRDVAARCVDADGAPVLFEGVPRALGVRRTVVHEGEDAGPAGAVCPVVVPRAAGIVTVDPGRRP
mmetsp:Transcript_106970/g.302489  ORF Transcript_106970/g.302489 Transcript_106970/m.302489 type:complete len:264 (+) Transcript_106970:2115-2906(+)